MLRWRDMHPYNAVHVVAIERPLDAAALARDIEAQLEFQGLTGLEVDTERRRYEYHGGNARITLAVLSGMPDPDEAMRVEMERQLNAPFPSSDRSEPFRFFAVDVGGRFYFGVAYDHFIAGGDSIAVLLKGITDRHSGVAADAPAPQLYPATFTRLFARRAWSFITGIPHFAMILVGCRRAYRPESHGGDDPQNALARLRIEGADFESLSHAAATWGVTTNELVIALLLRALSPLAADRWPGPRNQLAIGSIINVRNDYQPGPTRVFGQFLSSCRVASTVLPELALRDLALEVHVQLRRVRKRRLYLQMLVLIAVAGFVWPRLSPGQRARFHGKHYPLMSGITPLNVNALWRDAGGGAPPRYLRAVSTGPLAPLVVAATKAGDAIELGLSFRTTTFSRDDVDGIVRAVHEGIAGLES